MAKKKVVVGMSGGVDSSVAAYLLKEQGYDVVGVTMQMWQDGGEAAQGESGCPDGSAADDAAKVADAIGIPHLVMDFKSEFKENVMDYFVAEYVRGRTPNPCIMCNRYVKWEALLKKGRELGAEYLATGHYARIGRLPNGRFAVKNSVTAEKDQTYALYGLTQEQLKRTLMPVGEYGKDEIRLIAERAGLPVAHKKDSMEICFVPDDDYAGFIERERRGALPPPGNFVTVNGEVVGTHRGITHYTIGQRKGLGIAFGRPVFVVAIRPETNEVVLGGNEDVFAAGLDAELVNCMAVERFEEGMEFTAKIRYSHAGSRCRVTHASGDTISLSFYEPVRAVTAGQAVVLYDGEYVAGGGLIR